MKKYSNNLALYPICALLIFVLLHSLTPFDPRIRMGFKPFEPEFDLSVMQIWYSLKKWRHILWFLFFYIFLSKLIEANEKTKMKFKAFSIVLSVSFLIEFEECFVAGRHGRIADVLPNIVGSLLGAVTYKKLPILGKKINSVPFASKSLSKIVEICHKLNRNK